jgi:hypothetical protein
MKRTFLTIAILFFIAATGKLYSQDPATAYDLSEIQKVVNKLYENLTFKKNQAPTLAKLTDIFYDRGMLINNTTGEPKKYTLQEFSSVITKQVNTGKVLAFREKELSSEIELFGNMAHCLSTYESGYILAGRDEYINKRGINSIQLIKVAGKWKIVSIIWNEESDEQKIPEKYLKEE